jgi:AcrR family transcriptional regulator
MSQDVIIMADAAPEDAPADAAAGKRERSKAANRQAILDAARRVFGQLGYEAASVRDVIRGTDLASGTFYNYLKSKEELLEALQDDGARRFRPILREEVARARTFEDFVEGALVAYFRFVLAEQRETGGAVVHQAPWHGDTPEMRAVFEEVRGAIVQMLGDARARALDADYFAAACIGLAREVGVRMCARNDPNPDEIAHFCASMILSGMNGITRGAQ